MKKLSKRIIVGVLTLMLLCSSLFIPTAKASVPYDSYTYNFWLDPVESPNPYVPKDEFTGDPTTMGKFNNPQDLFITKDGIIYVADTDNNRIVFLDTSFQYIGEITTFHNGDTFNKPQGIFVTEGNHIFVADTENQRIVEFDENKQFVREILRPETELITDNTSFRPTKVVIDGAGRIYTLAIGINSGIVELNPDGTFQGFTGASEVNINPISYVWRRYFATDEQKKRMELIIPTEYNNLFLDNEEFIYVTMGNVDVKDYGIDVIRRLNPSGINVIRDFGYGSPIGDYFVRDQQDITRFNDITVTDYQVYTALDGVNGKLFTYDYDGNLLYVFGSNGARQGNFKNAVSVEQYQGTLYVLDNGNNSITSFELTEYGSLVNNAIKLHYEGKYEESAENWQQVLKFNANSDMAYIGLGKVYLRNGEYKKAMDYFKLANNRKYYSKAFTFYRRQFLGDNFGLIMTSVVIIIICILGLRVYLKTKKINVQKREVNGI
ncbi:tetratricopeptide repeat protein [Caldibacillus lycopersici]|uniref:Tetratricopeptide repeat protein n=1 Tax=Perspicuibacillus lycopersici TaxID=1325689 RepID=A0AAE3LPT2_9BACI|nr:tetratricopeptide repeat protein [Perspicuibacillus lycopersici]MCU9612639.1 tetratricopeptide repeat protein [Perspicuibacillus lycopersici]